MKKRTYSHWVSDQSKWKHSTFKRIYVSKVTGSNYRVYVSFTKAVAHTWRVRRTNSAIIWFQENNDTFNNLTMD